MEETKINSVEHFTSKLIRQFDQPIALMCPLKDNRLAIAFDKKIINIYDMSNNFNLDISIDAHKDIITWVAEMENGNLLSCGNDNTIRLWSLGKNTFKNEHTIENVFTGGPKVEDQNATETNVFKVEPVSNNRIVTFSSWNTLKIFSLEKPYSDKPLFEKDNVTLSYYAKDKDILITTSGDIKSTMYFYDMKTYQLKSSVDNGECFILSIERLDENRLIFGAMNMILILNMNEYKVEKTIKNDSFDMIFALAKFGDKSVACGGNKGIFVIDDYTKEKPEITKNKEEIEVFQFIEVDKETFLSAGDDKIIREFKVKH